MNFYSARSNTLKVSFDETPKELGKIPMISQSWKIEQLLVKFQWPVAGVLMYCLCWSSAIEMHCLCCDLQEKYDAFFVGDLGDVLRKHKLWASHLPRVEPFYGNVNVNHMITDWNLYTFIVTLQDS